MSKKSNELDGREKVGAMRPRGPHALHDVQPEAGPAPGASGKPPDVGAKAAVGAGQPQIRIDPEFQSLIPPLSVEEEALLEQSLVRERGPREPLVVWKGLGLLLDGHHRYTICIKKGLPYSIREVELSDRPAAVAWIDENQDGRRNLTPEGVSYRRGRRYLLEKRGHGGSRAGRKASGQNDHSKTDERLAAVYKVAEKTIRRDAQFAEAVDTLAKNCGEEVRRFILTRQSKLSQGAVVRLSQLPLAEQRKAAKDLLEHGKVLTPAPNRNAPTRRLPEDPEELAQHLVWSWTDEAVAAFQKALTRAKRQRVKDDSNRSLLNFMA